MQTLVRKFAIESNGEATENGGECGVRRREVCRVPQDHSWYLHISGLQQFMGYQFQPQYAFIPLTLKYHFCAKI